MNTWTERVRAALPKGWEARWDDATRTVHCLLDAEDEVFRFTVQPQGRPGDRWWALGHRSMPTSWPLGASGYGGRGFVSRMVRDALAAIKEVRG